MFLSKNTRPNMEPRMTEDGKYICDADNETFDSREDYDRHCSEAHLRSSGNKTW
jgi:hypothetical protein